MTPPINEKKQAPVLTGNVGLKASYKHYDTDRILLFGPTAEGRVQHKGFYAGAGVTAGTGLSADVEIGKEFDINKNWGLDLSANANYTRSLLKGNNQVSITQKVQVNDIVEEGREFAEWKPAITTAGLKVMTNYTTNNGKFTFGAGVSGQYARNNTKDISLTTTATDGQYTGSLTQWVNHHKEGVVLSPELKATWNANKNISVGANVNAFGGGITASYTF
jgi:hypothetical protein